MISVTWGDGMQRTAFILIGFITLLTSTALAQTDSTWVRRYDCHLKTGSIVINGVTDEFAWQLAPEVGEFTRFQKKGDLTVKHRTTAKMIWDEDNLYILVAVEDPDIWSTMTVGDKACLCEEETVEVFIDPDGDGYDYAELHFNCLNTINDIWIPQKTFKYRDGKPVDWIDLFAWNLTRMQHGVMNYGTVNDKSDVDQGTVYELALPWKGFGKIGGKANLPPKPGDVWRININRYERSRSGDIDVELSGWAPLDLNSYHVPERFGYVRFVDKQ